MAACFDQGVIELSSPHNWCDRLCERCPLATTCPIGVSELDPTTEQADLGEIIADGQRMLDEALREEGIDPDDVGPPPPPSAEAAALTRFAAELAKAVGRILRKAPAHADPEVVSELGSGVRMIAGKCARLATYIDDPPEDFDRDAAPNLLLLEVIGARVRAGLDALFDDEHRPAFDAILAELGTRQSPLHHQVSSAVRAELARRIERGEAPTPFLITQRLSQIR